MLRVQTMVAEFGGKTYADATGASHPVTLDMLNNLQGTLNNSPALAEEIKRAATAEELGVTADQRHRRAIEPYVRDGKLSIKRFQATPVDAPRLTVFNPETGEWVPNPTGIDNALGDLFPDPIHIGEMDDAAEDASKAKTSRLSAKGADRFAELHDIDASINTKVKDLFPGVSVRLDFPVPVLEELSKAGTVRYSKRGDVGTTRRKA